MKIKQTDNSQAKQTTTFLQKYFMQKIQWKTEIILNSYIQTKKQQQSKAKQNKTKTAWWGQYLSQNETLKQKLNLIKTES